MKTWLTALCALALIGCDGVTEPMADAGAGGEARPSTAVRVLGQAEACPNGGSEIAHGIDGDGDGVLDDEEVDGTTTVCNGADGAPGPQRGGG